MSYNLKTESKTYISLIEIQSLLLMFKTITWKLLKINYKNIFNIISD